MNGLLLYFVLYFVYLIMKNSKNTPEKPVAKAEQPVVVKTTKAAPKKTSSDQTSQKKAEAVAPKTKVEQPIVTVATEAAPKKPSPEPVAPAKVQAAAPKSSATTPELTMSERVGLTAGNIWSYLSENGATPVTKLVEALTEEEKVIQRSIGWLAQEDKITIDAAARIETIALKQ
ncbi:winged helix-turn-helix domain-containing protein [Methylomonas sp. BW4-1]|uniref:winged helix-turn-helix domain-containing protein n=1 Tax=Methylomonas sp. BW4-1 TaxID=3376685 RepID=UPI004041B102